MHEIPFALQWQIAENRLLLLKDSVDECLWSTIVTNIPEFEYYMAISPNGHSNEYPGKTWFYLHLEFKNVKKVVADYTITIESANFSRPRHLIYEKSMGWGHWICSTEEFFDAEKKFIVDGKVIVKVSGTFKFETETALPATISNGQQKWIGGEFGDVSWKRDDTKDFTIITGNGKEIKVHKFVLDIRSDVFMAMFNSNMKEATENKVTITDFSYNVVETGIKLIYDCNFSTSLSLDELMSLLQFLDKYNLETLKAKVERLLIDQISVSNVVRITNGLVLTNSSKLKEKCMEFLVAAIKSQTSLTDFKTLNKDIAFEVLENSFYQHLQTRK